MENACPIQRRIPLPTGDLDILFQENRFPLDHLIGFAARNNPKRGFLFVSRVLGKHIASKPSDMHRVHRWLAKRLSAQACEGTLLIGMAETAIGLGQGIYEAFLESSGARDALYSHTTRYFLSGLERVAFEESHSHAVEQYLYVPDEPHKRGLFLNARTLVLIDDEMTTGNTFRALIEAYRRLNPNLRSVVIVTLLNCVPTAWRASLANEVGLPVSMITALDGEASFRVNPDYRYKACATATGNASCKRDLLGLDTGRLGVLGALPLDRTALDGCTREWSPGERVLVLGTGEFMHLPYRIGLALEQAGWLVGIQSTTRSPILIAGAIASARTFRDNYHERIANYLYNVNPAHYDRILLCHETTPSQDLVCFARKLKAFLLRSRHGKILVSRP
ncbi:MAG: phosphoribosyltransferase domain-containing protein [Methylococcales bacterium]